MGTVTLNFPSYRKLGLVTLNLLCEKLTKCGLGQDTPGKQLRKLIAAETKLDRETINMVTISILLLSYPHIILALFVAPSRFGLPCNLLREK